MRKKQTIEQVDALSPEETEETVSENNGAIEESASEGERGAGGRRE